MDTTFQAGLAHQRPMLLDPPPAAPVAPLPRVRVEHRHTLTGRNTRRTEWTATCEACGATAGPFDRSRFAYEFSDGHRGLDSTLGIAPCETKAGA